MSSNKHDQWKEYCESRNAERVRMGSNAIEAGVHDYEDIDQTKLVDLMTNLRHWSLSHRVDFDAAVRLSGIHFPAESQGGEA